MKNSKKISLIALVGAESTGKTTLAQALIERLGGLALPEVLREFCDIHGRPPRAEEQRQITKLQIHAEVNAVAQAQEQNFDWIFIDSTPLMTAIYSELLFKESDFIAAAIRHHAGYSATLFLQPDIGWQADGIQRDGAHMQAPVTQALALYLPQTSTPFVSITGAGADRAQNALIALNELGLLPE